MEDPGALLYVYRRLYHYLGELTPAPKFLKRKGQSNLEAYLEYERDNLLLLNVYMNDLRYMGGRALTPVGIAVIVARPRLVNPSCFVMPLAGSTHSAWSRGGS